jgi:hypothetical protein
LLRKLISRSDVKAQSAVLKLKKRHVEMVTRLPTKRLATACWASIVAKSPEMDTEPRPANRSLRPANNNLSTSYSRAPVDKFGTRSTLGRCLTLAGQRMPCSLGFYPMAPPIALGASHLSGQSGKKTFAIEARAEELRVR